MTPLKQLMSTSIILNLAWAIIGSQISKLFNNDIGGFIIGTVFLLIYSSTYFSIFEKSKKSFYNFLMLTITITVIFLAASFVVPMFFINSETTFGIVIFLLASSGVALTSIVAIVGHFTIIQNKLRTIILGTIVTTIVASVFFVFLSPNNFDYEKLTQVVEPWAVGICIWQILTTFLIGRSIMTK